MLATPIASECTLHRVTDLHLRRLMLSHPRIHQHPMTEHGQERAQGTHVDWDHVALGKLGAPCWPPHGRSDGPIATRGSTCAVRSKLADLLW
jgi:hypothetical protein